MAYLTGLAGGGDGGNFAPGGAGCHSPRGLHAKYLQMLNIAHAGKYTSSYSFVYLYIVFICIGIDARMKVKLPNDFLANPTITS